MHVSPTAEVAALVLTVLVHFIGAGVLIWGMLGDERPSLRGLLGEDEGWGGGGDPAPEPPKGPTGGGDRVELLPGFDPSPVRLREGGTRIGDGRVPARRPEHPREPQRVPVQR